MRTESPHGQVPGALVVFCLFLGIVGLFSLAAEAHVFGIVVLIGASATVAMSVRSGPVR